MDFVRNRSFRQTLLCHGEVPLDRSLDPGRLDSLYVASSLAPTAEGANLNNTEPLEFSRGPLGLKTSLPLMKAALAHLAEAWPAWVHFDQLLAAAVGRLSADPVQDAGQVAQRRRVLSEHLLRCYGKTAVELHAHGPPFTTTPGPKPQVSPLARLQAESGPLVTNRQHTPVRLNDVNRHVLALLDGRHDRPALVKELARLITSGQLVLPAPAGAAGERRAELGAVEEALDKSLAAMTMQALLIV